MYKVLIVEDEDMIRKGIIFTFDWITSDCIIVGEASNGAEGLEMIRSLSPDIVITDVSMPIMSGLTMIEKSKADTIYSAIVVSAYDEFHLAKKAMQIGVTEYLVKPLDHNELSIALEHAKVQLEQKRLYSLAVSDDLMKDIEVLSIEKTKNLTSQRVIAMVSYIQNHYAEKISINDLVEPLATSATYLNQKFKEETSYTFNEFLNRYRIQQAINKLKNEDVKIYNVAMEVGFKDYRYFINVFKKYANCLPSSFLEYF